MDKEFKDLFNVILKNMEIVSEQTSDFYKDNQEKLQTILRARDLASQINEKIQNDQPLTKSEWFIVFTGATISKNLIKKNIMRQQAVIAMYEDMIPKIKELSESKEEDLSIKVKNFFDSKN